MKLRFTPWLVIALLAACSNLDDNTLAVIDGDNIPLEEFTSVNPATRFADKDSDYIQSKVDEFVQKTVFTKEAIAQGLDQSDDIQEKKSMAERRQMLQYVYNRAIVDAVIDDAKLKEIYDRSGKEINARHILLQFDGVQRARSNRSKIDALAVMGQIKNRLSQGESFEDLAKEYTDDPTGKDSGGDLGWFGWGKMVGPFQEVAFKLEPGEISDVVETAFGIHIIKVEAIREIERGTFEEEREALKNQARKDAGQLLSQKANEFLDEQKAAAGFEILTENVHDFFMIFDKSSFKQGPMDDVMKKIGFGAPLFTLGDEELGSDWIINELSKLDEGQKPRFNSENQLLTILDQLVTQTLIVDYGYAMGYDKEEAFAGRINEMVERYAYDAFIAKEINATLEPTEEELLAFYESNKEAKYMDPKKVQVREIFVKDSLFALDLKKRIDAGEMLDILAGRYTERKATKDKRGELPPFQEGRYGLMGQTAFSMEVGQIAGPIKLGNGYSIIKLEGVLDAGAKPYSKVKGRVRTEIMGDLRANRTAEVYEKVKSQHDVKINYAAALSFYKEANKK
jgi:parvulin-like peptidyl-prolyl isomerase